MVQKIEGLEAELKLEAFRQAHCLQGAEVHAHESWPSQDAPAGIAENFLIRRRGECCQIPPVRDIVRTVVGILPRYQVAVVYFEVGVVNRRVTPIQTRHRESGPHHADTADLPASQNRIDRPRQITAPSLPFAKWEFVKRAVYPIQLGIERRRAIVQPEVPDVRRGRSLSPPSREDEDVSSALDQVKELRNEKPCENRFSTLVCSEL